MPTHQIKQRKQEYPHNIDEMPIEPYQLDRRVVDRGKASATGLDNQSSQQSQSDDHVQRMHPGHRKVKGKKYFCRAPQGSAVAKIAAGHEVLLDFGVILREFDAE